eukprot:GCRY01000888.1.p1 GENE.GCRY01000888.1~~GCRY01000888.1.p1  ORF type:complete len:236 (+),score=34.14 GCRY01000888.1:166-873(+)
MEFLFNTLKSGFSSLSGTFTMSSIFVSLVYVFGVKLVQMQKQTVRQLYNVVMTLLSFLMFAWLSYVMYSSWGVDFHDELEEYKLPMLIFHFIRILEVMDTVFIIWGGHVPSFLHVYHHFVMIIWSAVNAEYFAIGSLAVPSIINSFVHVIMYAYYGATGSVTLKKLVAPLKHWITRMQMAQFSYILCYIIYDYIRCGQLKYFHTLGFGFQASLLFLFAWFYHQTFALKKGKKKLQ